MYVQGDYITDMNKPGSITHRSNLSNQIKF